MTNSENVILPTETKADETAFPIVHSNGVDSWTQQCGLTKREYFAAMAMQSVRAVNPACSSQEVAQSAVADADALLKELAK